MLDQEYQRIPWLMKCSIQWLTPALRSLISSGAILESLYQLSSQTRSKELPSSSSTTVLDSLKGVAETNLYSAIGPVCQHGSDKAAIDASAKFPKPSPNM